MCRGDWCGWEWLNSRRYDGMVIRGYEWDWGIGDDLNNREFVTCGGGFDCVRFFLKFDIGREKI